MVKKESGNLSVPCWKKSSKLPDNRWDLILQEIYNAGEKKSKSKYKKHTSMFF
jgi:hypothetical protein